MTLEREAAVPTCTRPGDDHNRPQNDEMLAGEETSTAAAPAKARVQSDGKAEISAATSAVQTASVLAAGARVMSLLPQIGSWAIGLSCFAYLSGQREVSSYLGMLGAPWAMALLSPTQLMQVGAVPATTVVTFGFIAFKSLLGGTSERRLQRWLLVLLASGVLLMLASFLGPNPTWKLRLAEGSTTLILVSAGVAVGELVASLRQTGEWGFRQFSLIDVVVLVALLGTSSFLGAARAEADAVRGESTLPIVSLSGKDVQPWRLVFSNGEKMLLMTPTATRAERQFRIVAASDVDAVMGN